MSILFCEGPETFCLSSEDLDLLRAYLDTDYVIDLEGTGPTVLLAGEAYPDELEGYSWEKGLAVITAWNPGSLSLPLNDNQSRQIALMSELQGNGFGPIYPAVGKSRSGAWAEDSLAIFDISMQDALHFGQLYGQNAILWVSKGGKPKIILCAPYWLSRRGVSTAIEMGD